MPIEGHNHLTSGSSAPSAASTTSVELVNDMATVTAADVNNALQLVIDAIADKNHEETLSVLHHFNERLLSLERRYARSEPHIRATAEGTQVFYKIDVL